MSTHRVDVIPVSLEPHPNADTLSIVRIAGFTAVVRTADWRDGELAAYIEPDSIVPADRPEFAFLGAGGAKVIENSAVRGYRIKVKKLRGVVSMGLLVKAPPGSKPGDNVIGQLGVVRYEPPMAISTGGDAVPAPAGSRPSYDVESGYRYADLFRDGEEVVVTEKVHGASARYCFVPGEGMYCGARSDWRARTGTNIWWRAMEVTPALAAFCEAHPEITVYGEVYGAVQDLRYGCGRGEALFVAFDLLRDGRWVEHDEARTLGAALPWVPVIHRGPWRREAIFALADGPSPLAASHRHEQIREGIVVKPIPERNVGGLGRVQVKIVSNEYLERA